MKNFFGTKMYLGIWICVSDSNVKKWILFGSPYKLVLSRLVLIHHQLIRWCSLRREVEAAVRFRHQRKLFSKDSLQRHWYYCDASWRNLLVFSSLHDWCWMSDHMGIFMEACECLLRISKQEHHEIYSSLRWTPALRMAMYWASLKHLFCLVPYSEKFWRGFNLAQGENDILLRLQYNLSNSSTQGTTEIVRITEMFELGGVKYKEKIAVGNEIWFELRRFELERLYWANVF